MCVFGLQGLGFTKDLCPEGIWGLGGCVGGVGWWCLVINGF